MTTLTDGHGVICLPASGVYVAEGLLFLHASLGNVKEEHIARLKEFGIPLDTRPRRFNATEDNIIRRNWTEFAKDHGIPYEDANLFVTKFRTKYMKHLSFKDTRFWPRMYRLLVLSRAFSRQLQKHGQPLPQVDIEVFNGRIQEQATNSPNVFPSLESEALVEALILHTISIQNDWKPPAKLKKYAKSEDVLSLFPVQKNNDEWLKEKDIVKPYLCESDSEEEVEIVEKLTASENQCDDVTTNRMHKKKKKRNKECLKSLDQDSGADPLPPKKKKRKKDRNND